MQKKARVYRVFSPEFKVAVIEDMLANNLGYKETEQKYNLAKMRAKRWERIYLEEGAEGLMKERRGKTSRGRPPKLDKAVEEDLIAEVQRLRMENEYLKKFNALALSRIKSENETKPE